MSYKTNKEKYQEVRHFAKKLYKEFNNIIDTEEHTNDKEVTFQKSFPYLVLQTFFDKHFTDDKEKLIDVLNIKDKQYGIDGLYIDENQGSIDIFKFEATDSPSDNLPNSTWFQYFQKLEELFTDTTIGNDDNKVSYSLQKILDDKENQTYTRKYHIFYTSNAKQNTNYKHINYYNIDNIYNELEDYNSKFATEPESCTIEFAEHENSSDRYDNEKDIYHYSPHGNYKTSVGLVTGYSLMKLFEENRYKLFDRNVRFFLGKNTVNKEIINTAKTEPTFFYYYNNGITITCEDFTKTGKLKLKLDFPQVINGAQTMQSLYEAYKEKQHESGSKAHFEKINVLVRVIQSPKADNAKFTTNLTKFTNSNNPVKPSDYKANSIEQENLQKELYKLGYYYIIKRGENKYYFDTKKNGTHNVIKNYVFKEIFKTTNHISMIKLAQIYCAYKTNQPDISIKPPNTIFSDNETKLYSKLFSKKVDNTEVKNMIFAYKLHKELEHLKKIGINFQNKETLTEEELEKLQDAFDERIINQFTDNPEPFNDLLEYFISSHYLILSAVGYIIIDKNFQQHIIDNYDSSTPLNSIRKFWIKIILKLIDANWKENKNKYKFFKAYAKKENAWQDLEKSIKSMYSDEYNRFNIDIKESGTDYIKTIK